MARPRRRLDLLWVPDDPDRALDPAAFEALRARWGSRGWLDGGPDAPAGGFVRLWLDQPERATLYANQVGGFQVRCPAAGASVVPAFIAAVTAWRAGGARALTCPACGATHALEHLDCRPPIAIARGAVVLSDVRDAALSTAAQDELAAVTGPGRTVLRRPG